MNPSRNQYDHLYLSAHFDDVALSCGGRVFQQTSAGESVLVVTVTAGEPPAEEASAAVRELHERWHRSLAEGTQSGSIVAQRAAEDRAAFAVLQADVVHLPFLDCIYRIGPDGTPLYPGPTDMFGAINPDDRQTITELAAALKSLPPAGRIYIPLGAGHHIDHQISRQAAEQVFPNLAYYEDYPYTMKPGAVDEVLPPADRTSWTSEIIQLTPAALAAKIKAISAYESQLSSFFSGPNDLATKLHQEGRRVILADPDSKIDPNDDTAVGERLWWRL